MVWPGTGWSANRYSENTRLAGPTEPGLRTKVWLHIHRLRHGKISRRNARTPTRARRQRTRRRTSHRRSGTSKDHGNTAQKAGTLSTTNEHDLNPYSRYVARSAGERYRRDRKSTRLNSSHSQISYA